LEEERRLAHVGITRARRRAKIYFATNRRIHGMWSTTIPSRFLDELPEAHVEVTEAVGGFGGSAYGASRFDNMDTYGSNYTTPGWQRAQARRGGGGFGGAGGRSRFGDNDRSGFDDAGGATYSASPLPERGRSADFAGRAGVNRNRGGPLTIEGELVAKSTGTTSAFSVGDRVFHIKFGNGNVVLVDGNKLTIQFDKAGEKRVVDSFVERV
jgi:DNA helicase-2/ATP-dependent DNA helicase PcrA